jgi:hypothetical protein
MAGSVGERRAIVVHEMETDEFALRHYFHNAKRQSII